MVHHHHLWSDAGSLGAIALWGVIGLVAAVRGFRWQPRDS
jgi:hypothetical protein